jgi:hypothetical protein
MIFNELIKENINNFNIELTSYNIIIIVILISISAFIYNTITSFINKGKFILILIIFLILIKIDDNLNTNEKFTNIKSNIKNIYSELNTGDFVLFRSYTNNDLLYILAMKLVLPSIQNYCFTHIGMIYKADNGKLYILENTPEMFYCHNLKRIVKNGVMMLDFMDRLNSIEDYRIHIVKTNIYKHINIDNLKNSIDRYKNYNMIDINCIEYITRLLYDSNVIKLPNGVINRYLFDDLLNKSNYNFDVEFNPIIIKDY